MKNSANQKFALCAHCGNLVGMIQDASVPLVCCGQEMKVLTPHTAEAGVEKHLPVVSLSYDSAHVKIGSLPHPMEEAHHISFVFVETQNGGQRKRLSVGDKPEVAFSFIDDKPLAVYAYCNLHGLWKTQIK
ncbi:MAG: desulfoferrodoxin [Firmicutes bacterium]|nr:desulfoferrodoxin [Bacillota bacterium]